MNWPDHGGQPQYIKALFDIDPNRPLTDFSANLNPLGSPEWLREAWAQAFRLLDKYPDPHYPEAREAIARHEGVARDQTLLTNGGAEAIFLVAKHYESGRALIVQPAFLEYERALNHYRVDIEHVYLDEQNGFAFPLQDVIARLQDIDLLFVCRPNNPTGTVADEPQMNALLEESRKAGVTVVVDEAFADFLPESVPPLTGWLARYPNLILLRSLTKIYTVPGLRIGYILASEQLIGAMRGYQIPWSVNAAAAYLTPQLLADRTLVGATKVWLARELAFLKEEIAMLDVYQSPALANFYLLRDCQRPDDTPALFRFLLERGILGRHTQTFRGLDGRYLRFAVRSRKENERLLACLREWRKTTGGS